MENSRTVSEWGREFEANGRKRKWVEGLERKPEGKIAIERHEYRHYTSHGTSLIRVK